MKLISCYIENFGNMKQRSFDFDKGLTSLCEHNGYGKTTLAAFLKAMFYGLKQTRASDKELGERARFYPFEGGKFGGNVVFEKSGVIYKIERFFGRKSATEDILTVYEDGELSNAGDDLGKEFFGLDEQSFLRTVFLNSSDTESGATGDISRMLNGFVDDADFDGAKKILEKQQKEYKAGRGRGGAIDEKHDEILNLKVSIENKEKINGELARKYGERRELASVIAELETRQNTSRDTNLVLQKWQTYDGFAIDASAERGKLNAINEKYPDGIPDEGEAGELKRNAEAINLANERMISAALSSEKAQRLEELSARFESGVPADGEINS
ncbi:MAG: AAA family ATPase, partial [Clostridia bacterium]|nr:AAA family ATPase [Clostridia bacterium]